MKCVNTSTISSTIPQPTIANATTTTTTTTTTTFATIKGYQHPASRFRQLQAPTTQGKPMCHAMSRSVSGYLLLCCVS
jgi:hypothetical protein